MPPLFHIEVMKAALDAAKQGATADDFIAYFIAAAAGMQANRAFCVDLAATIQEELNNATR